jgi:MoaA/NifB/PqqE/SkfB family radical SAM enzyme
MNVSVNPWYYCNFRCEFCYLTKEQLSDNTKIDLEVLNKRLSELPKIDCIDLYGGEIGLLPESYFNEMTDIFLSYNPEKMNMITNLSMVNDIVRNKNYELFVSYDFDTREKHELVYRNMATFDDYFNVLILANEKIIKQDVNNMIEMLNLLNNLVSVEIKPYSINQANQYNVSHKDYEEFVKKWIKSDIEKNFEFNNVIELQKSIDKIRNSFSDDHIYITPEGHFAVLDFDLNDREYFLQCENYEDYLKWCEKEKNRVSKNKFCNSCEYFGNCLSEHLREVKNLDNGCNGYKNLIDWYKNARAQN